VTGDSAAGRCHLVTAASLPAELTALTSAVAFSFPFELEAGATPDEIAVGAFIAGFLGLLARGSIEVLVDEVRRTAWVRRRERASHFPGKLEHAVQDGLDAFDRQTSYRTSDASWAPLLDLLGWCSDQLPSKSELASARLASPHLAHVAEQVALAMPLLFSALAAAAVCLVEAPRG